MPYKPCPKCQKHNGVRTLTCECGFEFRKSKPYKIKQTTNKPKVLPVLSELTPEPKKINSKSVPWTDLEKGDKVKVSKDSGPRMVLSDGVEVCIGHHGVFTVHKLDLNGIHAYGKNGYAFLWMGQEEFSKETGIRRTQHKIKRLK